MNRSTRHVAIALVLAASAIVACTRQAPRAHAVAMKNFGFVPAEVTVAPGDTVVWSNTDFVPHSTTATDSLWDSKAIEAGATWRLVERQPGRHDYFCVFHPNMKATVIVR